MRWVHGVALMAGAWMVAAGTGSAHAAPLGRSTSVRMRTAQSESYAPPADGVDSPTAYPAMPPPDPIPESVPPVPGYGYMWINGYWDWTGYDWTWYSGFWTPRRAGITFYAPQYSFVNGELVYYRPYWADPYGRREYGYGWRGAPPAAWRARPTVAPMAWRSAHNEGWRRSPGAPTAWRAPAHREFVGGRPVAGAAPRYGYSKEKMPKAEERPMAEPGRPVPHEQPAPAGGWHGGPPAHPEPIAAGANRSPAVGGPHPGGAPPPPAAHPMAPAPHPAAPPPAHNAPSSRKK